MINATDYLTPLAKVMHEEKDSLALSDQRKNYDELYAVIHTDLAVQLKKSHYPNAPALSKKFNRFLEEMEPLYLCPELVDTGCLLVSGYHTNTLFLEFRDAFQHWETIRFLAKSQTQIPFLIVNSSVDKLEALNYANQRVTLTLSEFEQLIMGSGQNRVALNKIVQVFILHTPLPSANRSLIFDNIYHAADDRFGRAICRRIAYIELQGIRTFRKDSVQRFDAVTCRPEVEDALKQHPVLGQCPFMAWEQLVPCLVQTMRPVLYGFRYQFQMLSTQIESYYLKKRRESHDISREITEDFVRLGGAKDKTLTAIRQSALDQEKELDKEWKALQMVLKKISDILSETEKDLGDVHQIQKEVSRRVLDDVFEEFFAGVAEKGIEARRIESCLTTLEYPDLHLVQAYLQYKEGKKIRVPSVTVKPDEWEKAKMLLELQDINSMSTKTLQQYIEMLDPEHLSTGKEYYAKSIVANSLSGSIEFLQESLARGYAPAGEKLWQLYLSDSQAVDIAPLVYALLPEACEKRGQQSSPSFSNNDYADLANRSFCYYKLAAAKEYLPAIQFMVDKIYTTCFSTVQPTTPAKTNQRRKENGRIVCSLCRFLINDRMYQVRHNSEILGVILFCLGESYSDSMRLLSGINTGAANFCKGSMFQHGYGVAANVATAIDYYQKAWDQGFQDERLKKALESCRKAQKKEEKAKSTSYNPNNSYNSTTSNHSRSQDNGCFITTATCRALHADDDCPELNLLRWFRDAKLQTTPQGEAIVREYYRIGPLLVNAIDHSESPAELYQSLWKTYICPSCSAIENQQWEDAKRLYVHMVKELCIQFGVEVRPQIHEALKTY